MEERRTSTQWLFAVASIMSVVVGSIGLLTFVQSSERRLTTMEIRIENLKDSIDRLSTNIGTVRQIK